MLSIDKDLWNAGPASGAPLHLVPPFRMAENIDDASRYPLAPEER
jgi:hypothetical protein